MFAPRPFNEFIEQKFVAKVNAIKAANADNWAVGILRGLGKCVKTLESKITSGHGQPL